MARTNEVLQVWGAVTIGALAASALIASCTASDSLNNANGMAQSAITDGGPGPGPDGGPRTDGGTDAGTPPPPPDAGPADGGDDNCTDYNDIATLENLDNLNYSADAGQGVQPASTRAALCGANSICGQASPTCSCPNVNVVCTYLPAGTAGMCQGCTIFMPPSSAQSMGYQCGSTIQNPYLSPTYPLLHSGSQATVYCTMEHEGSHACVSGNPPKPSCNEAQAFGAGSACMQAYYNANCGTPAHFADCGVLQSNLNLHNAGQSFTQCKCNGGGNQACFNQCWATYGSLCNQIYSMYAGNP